MLVYDPVSDRNMPFGTLKTAALGKYLIGRSILRKHLMFCLGNSKSVLNPRPCCTLLLSNDTFQVAYCSEVKIFDLLYLNGTSLLRKSLRFRKRNLRACLREIPGRVEFAEEAEGRTTKDVRERMDTIVANRGEGLVIKHPDSEYVLNGRNKDWIKV